MVDRELKEVSQAAELSSKFRRHTHCPADLVKFQDECTKAMMRKKYYKKDHGKHEHERNKA